MRSNNRQLGINMIASMLSYFVSYAIYFFLTPYIVKELGVAAYGFVGLSNQIIGYSSLITIALNSMAGRFITIEYHKGNIEKANSYYSSVFYGNCIISVFLLIVSSILVIYLDRVINIPDDLIVDVKILFSFLAFNTILGLVANVYATATFIKNRLDYTNIRDVIGNFIKAGVLILFFTLLAPKVWYFGFTSLVLTLYVSYTNYRFTVKHTPDLCINKSYYDFSRIKELVISGVWNLITKLSTLLETGFNLLIANLFIGAELTGAFALSTTVPMMINSICAKMASNFAPSWTQLYALENKDSLRGEILKSIRIMGFIASIPISLFIVLGKDFYQLWVPTQDADLLFWLSVVGLLVMIVAMPLEPLWNIFTITNKVKKTSINLLEWSVAIFSCVLIGMFVTENPLARLFILASVRSVLATIRTLTFLPLFGAKCLGYKKTVFYPAILRNLICIGGIILLSSLISFINMPVSWGALVLKALFVSAIGVVCNWFLSLNSSDRKYFMTIIRNKIH